MQLHMVEQVEKIAKLPRVNQQFIGLGRELEEHRRHRRLAQKQHQLIENRVLLLQKQQEKASRDHLKKKRKLQQIIEVRQRQEHQSMQKMRLMQEKTQELERLKRQNQINRIIHKNNFESNYTQLRDRNHSDYSRLRQERIDGQFAKKKFKHNDFQEKRDNWLSLNISKEKGKQRIDKYFKTKNKQHIQEYQSRIHFQQKQRDSRISSIKNLEMREQDLRIKLESTTMKNSKMEQLINNISRTISPMNTRDIEAQLFTTSRAAKKSYDTLHLGQSSFQKSIQNIQTSTGGMKTGNKTLSARQKYENSEEVQQNIELVDDEVDKSGFNIVHKRRKNKHINRYKEYQAY